MVAGQCRGHRAWSCALLLLAALAWLGTPVPALGASGLPDVDVAMVVEIRDTDSWLSFYEEVLGTPREAPKPLAVSVNGRTGGTRWITVLQPKFNTELYLAHGIHSLKVVVSGKVAGAEALRGLATFEHAVLEIQAGAVDNNLILSYGLSNTTGQLLELHLARP
jgi:hypothetical protein